MIVKSSPFYRKRFFRRLLPVLVLGALVLGGFIMRNDRALRCVFLVDQKFDRIEERIFVSPTTPPELRNELRWHLRRAELRNNRFWHGRRARPKVIYCHDPAVYRRFGGRNQAVTHLTPQGAFVVIGPHSLSTDILAHELCHAELFQRVGWRNSLFNRPAWFDEGLALLLDHRFVARPSERRSHRERVQAMLSAIDIIHRPPLDSLLRQHDFPHHNPRQNRAAYYAAGWEVARWLDNVGPGGLEELTKALGEGEPFRRVYPRIELLALNRSGK